MYYVSPDFEINSFTDNSLYQYYSSTNCLTILDDVISKNIIAEDEIVNIDNQKHACPISKKVKDAYKVHYLCQCYDMLLKNGTNDLIFDMLNTSNPYDKFAICLVAIIHENMDIIQMLVRLNFDFDQCIYTYVPHNTSNRIENLSLYVTIDNFLYYAVQHNKKNIVNHLIHHGVKIKINYVYHLFCYINNYDISLLDNILGQLEKDSTTLLIENISYGYNNIVDRLLNMDPGLNINMVKSDLIKYKTFYGYGYRNINLTTLKLLINYGLIVDDDLFQDIFQSNSIDTIDYLMTEYHFIPHNESITKLFQDMNKDLRKFELLTKHNIDLSNVKHFSESDKSYKFMNSLRNCNMDVETLTAFLIDKYCL